MRKWYPKPMLFVLTICIGFNVFARTWYVNQNNSASLRNGHYWLTALQSLSQALDSASVGDTICVAAGNYVPGNATNSTFRLKNEVVLLGGYSTSDTAAIRNFRTNKTILSGQFTTNAKVLHVVTALSCDGLTVLDGFIIQDGFAYGDGVTPETNMGGGILLSEASALQIRNCVLRNNSGDKGSAVAIEQNSNPYFLNCYFLNNYAFGSGTVSIEDATASRFINCVFANNFAGLTGAIIFSSHSGVSLINCTAFRNRVVQSADLPPGCVSAQNGSSLTINNSIFFANSTDVASNFNIDKMDYQSPEITVAGSTVSVSNSITQNYTSGTNLIISENPRFRDTSNIAGPDNLFFTSDDGLQLMLPCSPALNSGSNTNLAGITTDITGSNRIFNDNADMGAFEAQSVPGTPMRVVYVNAQANGTNDGSSWTNAFTNLQQALLYCADTIKVAAGTYFPSSNNTTSSFWLRDRLIILGGYPNTGNPVDRQRNPSTNITRLSGALPGANGAKSELVVFANRVDSTCALDGLFISDANSVSQDRGKSGVRITNQSNPRFNNCVIENNLGASGGGLQVDLQSSPSFTNCRLKNNSGENGSAFFIRNGGRTSFRNCQFTTNSNPVTNAGSNWGGAGSITRAEVHFDSCTFTKNFSNNGGGALYMFDSATAIFRGCGFYGNAIHNVYGNGGNDIFQVRTIAFYYNCVFSDSSSAARGGAIYNNDCAPYFENCEFRNGQAAVGGAVYNDAASPVFNNCVFYKNYAGTGGVLYNLSGSQPKMLNCLVSDNQVSTSGTVAYNDQSTLEVINSTLTRNVSQTNSPGVFVNKNNSTLTIRNSILWANQLGLGPFSQSYEISNTTGSVTDLYNTLTQFYGTNGANNNLVGIKPRLVDYYDADGPDDKFFTPDDGDRLSACSPLINAGLTAYANNIATDLAGKGRLFGSSVDIGAYEFQNSVDNTSVFYVNPLASGTNDGTSWSNAYTSLHMALANTCADTIKVAKGVYYTAAANVDSSFFVRNGTTILGGYPNTGNPVDSQRDPVQNPVVLTGNIGNLSDSSDNANHVMTLDYTDGSSILDGLTVQDGFSRVQPGDVSRQSGGGIQVIGSDVQIRNCVVRKNFATGGGGLFISTSSKFSVEKSVFENNKAASSGGGISLSSAGTILNSVFSGNQASNTGGGMYSAGGNVGVTNCVFYKNRSDFGGGGAYNNGALNVKYTNCSFVSNAAVFRNGGGVYVSQSNASEKPKFYNSVFYNNTFSGQNLASSDAYLTQCDYIGSCNYDVFFNCALQKIGNTTDQVFNQPNFVDINNGIGNDNQWMTKDDGLVLTHCSALIDKGSNAAVAGINTDVTDQPRILNTTVDVGAYEYMPSLHGTGIASNAGDSLIANKEITDTTGWTHYFHDCAYLFSIRKQGRDIGSIADGSITIGVVVGPAYGSNQAVNLSGARFNTGGSGFYAFNKYWFARSNRGLSDSLLARFPYAQTDFTDLKGSLPTLTDPSQLQFYSAPNLSYPFNVGTAPDSIVQYQHGVQASTSAWVDRQLDNFYVSEFYIRALGSGTGFSTSVGPLSDLTLDNLTLSSSSAATANVFTVNLNEKNNGAAVAGYHKVSYYLSLDSILNSPDVLLGDMDVNQYLQPMQSVPLQKQLTVPCATVPGNYYVLAITDKDNHVAESNKQNNISSRIMQIIQGPSPLTNVSIISNRSRDTLCSPDSAILTISAPGCIGCRYVWVPGGDTTQSITVRNSGFLTAHVSNACGSVNVNKTILFQNGPSISPSANPSSICLGNSFTMYDLGGGLQADSIIWTGPNLSVSSKPPFAVKPTVAGNLLYTETAYGRASVCSTRKTIVVAVGDTAQSTVQISLNGCTNPAVFRVVATTAAGVHPTFKWYRNDTLLSQGDSVLSLNNPGFGSRIYVVMTADNLCNKFDTAWSNQIVYSCFPTAVVDVPGVSELHIGPNPSNGQFFIRMKLERPRRITASIFNATGNKIFALVESVWSGEVTKWLNLQSQPSGLYVMELLIDGKPYSIKLLIAR